MDYITDYPTLCKECQATIKIIAGYIRELPSEYSSDPEGPIMYAYDQQLLCNGHECNPQGDWAILYGDPPVDWDDEESAAIWGYINGPVCHNEDVDEVWDWLWELGVFSYDESKKQRYILDHPVRMLAVTTGYEDPDEPITKTGNQVAILEYN